MLKYKIGTESWTSDEMDSLNEALIKYESVKDNQLAEGVTYESYVELVSSEDDFEDCKVLKRANIVIDKERMEKELPRELGFDFEYWARWEEVNVTKDIRMKDLKQWLHNNAPQYLDLISEMENKINYYEKVSK